MSRRSPEITEGAGLGEGPSSEKALASPTKWEFLASAPIPLIKLYTNKTLAVPFRACRAWT